MISLNSTCVLSLQRSPTFQLLCCLNKLASDSSFPSRTPAQLLIKQHQQPSLTTGYSTGKIPKHIVCIFQFFLGQKCIFVVYWVRQLEIVGFSMRKVWWYSLTSTYLCNMGFWYYRTCESREADALYTLSTETKVMNRGDVRSSVKQNSLSDSQCHEQYESKQNWRKNICVSHYSS